MRYPERSLGRECGACAIPVFLQLRQMLFRPAAEHVQRIDQRPPEAREGVLDFRRHDGMNFTQHQAVALETAQRLREHLLRNATDLALQRGVALRPVCQDLNDERSPFIRDPIKDDARRALRF